MKVFDKKLLRDLFRSKGMIFAIISIIAVGTGCFIGMLSTYFNLDEAKNDFYHRCTMADFWIDLKKTPVSEVKQLKTIEGISALRDRISFPVIVDLENVDQPISAQAVSLPDQPESVINGIYLRSGSYFQPGEKNQVIISEDFARARNLLPGMYVHLILNGQRKRLFIVGTAISSEHIYLAPPSGFSTDPGNYGIFYIPRSFAENVFGFHGACNSISGLLTTQGHYRQGIVFQQLKQCLEPFGIFTITPLKDQFSNLTLGAEMGGLKTMSTMLPLIFLGVAALVLNVLMTRMAEQQRTIIGTLKALGYDNRTVLLHFLKFGLIVGFLGGVAGCGIGILLAKGMIELYKTVFTFPKLAIRFHPLIMISGILISVFFAVLGTLKGVKNVVKLNPAEAMRESIPESGGAILIERWETVWQRLTLWWQIILRNIFRNKIRTAIGIFAAAMGSALVLLSFGFLNSLEHMIQFQFTKVLLSDYDLSLKDGVDSEAISETKRLPGVLYAEPIFTVPCTFHNENHVKKGAITGLLSNAELTIPRKINGDAVSVPTVGLLMTRRLAKHLQVSEGDTVEFVPIKGIKKRHKVPVVRIINSMIGLAVYANYAYLNGLVGEQDAVTQLQLKTDQDQQIESTFYRELKHLPKLESVSSIHQQKTAIKNQLTQAMSSFATIMILFAGVIFFGSILNASLISISERQREIATFRVLGYHSREIGAMFLRENILVNIIGAVLGLPVGYALLFLMMTQFRNDAFSLPGAIFSSSYGWTIVLSFVFIFAAQWFVQRAINKLDWNEAINYKE